MRTYCYVIADKENVYVDICLAVAGCGMSNDVEHELSSELADFETP